MARESTTPEALAALGAEALAQVLIVHANTDPVCARSSACCSPEPRDPVSMAVFRPGRSPESSSR